MTQLFRCLLPWAPGEVQGSTLAWGGSVSSSGAGMGASLDVDLEGRGGVGARGSNLWHLWTEKRSIKARGRGHMTEAGRGEGEEKGNKDLEGWSVLEVKKRRQGGEWNTIITRTEPYPGCKGRRKFPGGASQSAFRSHLLNPCTYAKHSTVLLVRSRKRPPDLEDRKL